MDMILLAAATSVDLFAAVLGIRASGIRLTTLSGLAIVLTGSALLGLSAAVSSYADKFVPLDAALLISRGILLIMGLYTLFGDMIGKMWRELFSARKNVQGGIRSFVQDLLAGNSIMNHPETADRDNSKTISLSEGITLGLALSGDSVFSGVGAGIGGISPLGIFLLSLIFGAAAIISGYTAGRFLAGKGSSIFPMEKLGGVILIILAFVL